MAGQDWQKTTIWQHLESMGNAAAKTRHYVTNWLTQVETILAKGGTAPLDFTLHDDEHSFRVAQRISQLIPDETAKHLSDIEWALLLKAAYLHDIGMNPRRDVLKQVRDFLFSGMPPEFLRNEAQELQQWLDETEPGLQPPVYEGLPPAERANKIDRLTAFFARHRHNDWSEKYIVDEAQTKGPAPYPSWLNDLIALCKSHHYGLDELMRPKFDLRIVDVGNKLINLRYLAALLRVADILEFDPERTPPVVFNLRDVSPGSHIYWHKDQAIVLGVNRDPYNLVFTARTKNAWLHKAVIETADMVDAELQNCAAIEQQNGYTRGIKLDGADNYRWPWPMRLVRDIRPEEDTFVYIDGAFRPEPRRIVELLGGTRLYDTPFAAIRELLQNAFDAVRERMAYQLLSDVTKDLKAAQSARAKLHRVELKFEREGGHTWLVCTDTGIGMTRRVIESYLLVSGAKPRPETLELRRRCAERGIELARSGEFGIGTLSYFILCDKLIIETRASSEIPQNSDLHGWRFESDGLEHFGELRPLKRSDVGTTIRLRLREDYKTPECLAKMIAYVPHVVRKIPCCMTLRNIDGELLEFETGWTLSSEPTNEFVDSLSVDWRSRDSNDLKSNELSAALESSAHRASEVEARARKSIRFLGPKEFDDENGLGHVRLHPAYFDIEGDPSAYFLDCRDGILTRMPDGKIASRPSLLWKESWRGFASSMGFRQSKPASFIPALIEIDVVSGGKISMDRTRVFMGEEYNIIISSTLKSLKTALDPYTEFFMRSKFAVLTGDMFLGPAKQYESDCYWAFARDFDEEGEPLSWDWRPIQFPVVSINESVGKYSKPTSRSALEKVGANDELRKFGAGIDCVPWLKPTRILFKKRATWLEPVLFYKDKTFREDDRLSMEFPSEWDFLAIINDDQVIFNSKHPLFREVSPSDWMKYRAATEDLAIGDILEFLIKSPRSNTLAFILANSKVGTEHWNAIRDNFPKHFAEILGVSGRFRIFVPGYRGGIQEITSEGATFNQIKNQHSGELAIIGEGFDYDH
ncbi:MAG: ATP-binding protein [Methylocystis sp.]|nr:ATP-binding protein [Methylocystis sp.]